MTANYYVKICTDDWDFIDTIPLNTPDIHLAEAKAEEIADACFEGPVNLMLCDKHGELLWSWRYDFRVWC